MKAETKEKVIKGNNCFVYYRYIFIYFVELNSLNGTNKYKIVPQPRVYYFEGISSIIALPNHSLTASHCHCSTFRNATD